MTPAEARRFEKLATAIRRISAYSTPGQIRREYGGRDSGLGFEEALSYAYENMRNEARAVVSLVRPKKSRLPVAREAQDSPSASTVNDGESRKDGLDV